MSDRTTGATLAETERLLRLSEITRRDGFWKRICVVMADGLKASADTDSVKDVFDFMTAFEAVLPWFAALTASFADAQNGGGS